MPDYGAIYTDKKISEVNRELRKTYKTAQRELKQKLSNFEKRFAVENKRKKEQLAKGRITQDDYRSWMTGRVFVRNQWESNIRQVNSVILDVNKQAMNIVNTSRFDVFAENYNFMAWQGERAINASFNLYNAESVAKLILEEPQLLPEWKIDEKKDYKWNYKRVNNIVRQGIIQGEGVPEITERLCRELATGNEAKMRMFARTALNEAQNAGRQQQMNDAHKMGIEVKKQWLATLDGRTRDSHRYLDGQEVPYNKPFKSLLGDIMFPGDPTADAADVFNCRCTMVTIYPKYDTGRDDWRQNEVIDGQSYAEWKQGKKERGEEHEPSELERKLRSVSNEKHAVDISTIPTLKEYKQAAEWAKDALKYEFEELKEGWVNVPEQIDAIEAFERAIPKYEQIVRDAVKDNEFSTRTDSNALCNILSDGRFKTQFETGASHGVLDEKMRTNAASQLFAYGESLSIPQNGHEVYGYLDKAPRASMYGGCRVVLKKDNLIDRTTLTIGDSLELDQTGADPFATLVSNPGIESYGVKTFHHSLPNAKTTLADVERNFESIKQNGCLTGGNYIELQFHGGVTVDDIEYIQLSKQDLRASEIEELANERGVTIKWVK